MKLLVSACLCLCTVLAQQAAIVASIPDGNPVVSYNGKAMTPPMGWNNWAAFKCDVSEDLLLETAQRLVDLGLRDLGYRYVILDDCWSMGRDPNTDELIPSTVKFPHGMKSVADRLHGLDLFFGMYSSAGRWTCAGYEGSLGHEQVDANTFARWGVDYLKYDNCFNDGQSGTPQLSYERYKAMSDALVQSGRKIVYALCNWGDDSPWDWAPTIANVWRMAGDLYDSYDRPDVRCPCSGDDYYCKLPGYFCSFMNVLNKAAFVLSKTRPGAWNDLDMLEIGNGASSDDEYKTLFSMWAAVKSPLLMATDVRKLDARAFSIYTNAAVIAVNQDPLGAAAHRIWRRYVDDKDEYDQGEISLWSGPLSGGDYVVALVNSGNRTRDMSASLHDVFVSEGPRGHNTQSHQSWDIYDLWANRINDSTAQAVLDGRLAASKVVFSGSYKDAVAAGDERVMGRRIGMVKAHGEIRATVERHSVALLRLRQTQEDVREL